MKSSLVYGVAALCLSAVSLLASIPASAQGGQADETDSLLLDKIWNFTYETRFDDQNVDFRRRGPGETMTLGEFFAEFDIARPSGVVVCSKDEDGNTSVRKLSGKAEMEGFDLFAAVNRKEADGSWVPRRGENVILSLAYGPSDPYTSGLLFIRNTSGNAPKDFIRVSMILPPRIEADDMRSFSQSEAAPLTCSYLLSFETGDATGYMEEFRQTYASAVEKNRTGAEYDDLEYACILGLIDFPPNNISLPSAEEDIETGRYYDAIAWLNTLLESYKYFWKGDDADKSRYADACGDLAKCYQKVGEMDLACRFYELAYLLDNSYSEDYVLTLAAAGDIRAKGREEQELARLYSEAIARQKEGLSGFSPNLTLGDVVCMGLGIPECGIHSMTAYDTDGKVISRGKDRKGTLGTRLVPLLSDGNTIVFDYDLEKSQTQADSSGLQFDNSVAILVKKIEGVPGKYRLNVMIPNFIGFDTKRSLFDRGSNPNRPASISLVVSSEENGTVPDDLEGLINQAIDVQDDGRYLESLKLFNHILQVIKASDYEADGVDVGTLIDVCYEIGFCLSEVGQWDKALYYQSIGSQRGVTDYAVDYLNTLVNNHEPLTLGELERFGATELQEGGISKQDFESFLKRRKVYYLVEMSRYDEAESILKGLLDDPALGGFAKSELEYIDSLRSE